MPEIAEVRVVANVLKKNILKKKIKSIEILYPNIIDGDTNDFQNKLKGLSFENISTYGKWIIFNLGEYSLLSHLRMEGKYYYLDSSMPYEKHTHVIFHLDNNYDLRYNDVRKFGRMKLVKTSDIYGDCAIKKLGKEPDDKSLTKAYLKEKLKRDKRPIKDILLDQTVINGLGNIYANEVLFCSNINPLKKGLDLNDVDIENIIINSKRIIKRAYELGGCTIKSYTSSLGVTGHYQEELKVHMREGKKCFNCNEIINKIKINGRSTYYCPKCQK